MTTQMKKDSSFLALLYLTSPAFSHDYSVLYILFGISMVVTALIGFCLHGTRKDFKFISVSITYQNLRQKSVTK